MKRTKRTISLLLTILLLITAIPIGSLGADLAPKTNGKKEPGFSWNPDGSLLLADDSAAAPTWAFDYTEKNGAVHHKGDAITTKADFIKNNVLTILYSGEGLNTLFESLYADAGSAAIEPVWRDGEPYDLRVCHVYAQGIPCLAELVIPLEPMMFRPNYKSEVDWYRYFDGSRLPYSYNEVLQSLFTARLFSEKAAQWSATIMGKHKADLSFWRVPDTVTVNGTQAIVPTQTSRSPWPSNGHVVDLFVVDAVTDVVDWSPMKDDPQKTWELDPGDPNTLYSALAACFCGYASVISAALSGNMIRTENEFALTSVSAETVIRNTSRAGIFYTQFLQPLYQALGIAQYPSLEQLAADAAVCPTVGKTYGFRVNAGLTLFRDMLAPIMDWVETVLFADPVNTLASVAPTVSALLDPNDENSILNMPAVDVSFEINGFDCPILSLCYKDMLAKTLDLLDPNSLLEDYLQCAQGHAWNDGAVTIPATCIAAGEKTFFCIRCGATKTEPVSVDASNHVNTADFAATASTCTAHGYTAGTFCNDCQRWISGHAQQPLGGHAWGEWVVVKQATVNETGLMRRTCANDPSHVEEQVIPKLKPQTDTFRQFLEWLKTFFKNILDWLRILFR